MRELDGLKCFLIWYVGPTRDLAKEIIWRRLKSVTRHLWIKKPLEESLRIDLKNAAFILVKGGFKPDNLRCTGLDFVVLDEAARNSKPNSPPSATIAPITPSYLNGTSAKSISNLPCPSSGKGIAAILSTEADLSLVAEANNGSDAVSLFRQHRPDVTLMDLRLPDQSGEQTTRQIRSEFPDARIIALTSYDGDQDIYRALEAGVRGYLLKEMLHTEIVRAIRMVNAGKRFIPHEVSQQLSGFFPEVALTPREVEVLTLVARGLGNKEVGDVLGTAPGTVKAHVQSILGKLEAKDRTHAVTIAISRGIIHLESTRLFNA